MSSLLSRPESAAHVAEVEASALYEQHRHRVYRFCLGRLADREEAHDAVQDTYAKAWLALRDGCVVREPLPWLLTIARNVCASRYRARSARPVETPLSDETAATVTSITRTELAGLPAAIRALPHEQRRAFVLRELRGCSYEEICDTMSTSQASVAALLHRARRSVAATLTGTGRRVLVIVPFPAVLRSAFEGGGAVVAATAAATATGAMLLVGPHLPLQHHSGPSAPGRVHHAPPARAPFVVPTAVGSRFGNDPVASAGPKEPVVDSPRVGASPMLSSSGGPSVVARVPTAGGAAGSDIPAAESLQPSDDASAGTAPDEPTRSESSGGGGSTAATPVATIPASTAASAPSGDAQIGENAATKSHANGPPADPGSQEQGNGNAYGQANGNGLPADPGSHGHMQGPHANGPPADPGSQEQGNGNAYGQGNGNAYGQANGNGLPADPGSHGHMQGPPTDPAQQGQGNGQPADPGAQGNGRGVGSAGGNSQGGTPSELGSQGNGQGVGSAGGNGPAGTPSEPGSQGGQGGGGPGDRKDKDPKKP